MSSPFGLHASIKSINDSLFIYFIMVVFSSKKHLDILKDDYIVGNPPHARQIELYRLSIF
jgi:hypothetical protein